MIKIKLLGGSKKTFLKDELIVEANHITISALLEILQKSIPKNAPQLDIKNTLFAINGIDSSTLDGLATVVKEGDVISIIPVIHGGSVRSIQFKIFKKNIVLIEIKNDLNDPIEFLENLRHQHRDLIIQGISSKYILNNEHAKKIITVSIVANQTGNMLSNKLETDLLMRFAGTRQINRAIQKVGIKRRENFFLIGIGNNSSLYKLYSKLKHFSMPIVYSNRSRFLKKEFRISEKQLKTIISSSPLEDLLEEKSAILFR